jgi:transposase InsO family protein
VEVKALQKKVQRLKLALADATLERDSLAERVNGILKDEYLWDATFTDYRQAEQACREAVRLYNTRRPHWALNFKTPEEVHQTA